MNLHFTYEINESKIREQLKAFEIEPTADDWNAIVNIQIAESKVNRRNMDSVINFTLNRNILIPAAFGLMLVTFSILIFNFISIKPSVNSVDNAETLKTPEPSTAIGTTPSNPTQNLKSKPNENHGNKSVLLKSDSLMVLNSNPTTNKTIITKSDSTGTEKEKNRLLVNKQVIPIANSNDSTKPIANVQVADSSSNSNDQFEASRKKKKSGAIESLLQESDKVLRPTLVTEEKESDARPEENP